MTVADLRAYFAGLRAALEAAGAKGVAADLAAVETGLSPFAGLPVRQFADFLARCDAFSRGEVPVAPPKATKRPATPKAPKAMPADAEAVLAKVRQLYDRAIQPDMTEARITEELAPLLDPLSKDALVAIAEQFQTPGLNRRSKATVAEAIRDKITDRRGAYIRSGMAN